MRPQVITTSVLTNDADGIAQAQQTPGAQDLTLNGVLVSGGVATAAMAQKVVLDSAGNLSGVNFTITGTNADGAAISEVKAGPNTTPTTSVKYYKTVSSIAVSGAVGTNVTAGWRVDDGFCTQSVPVNWRQVPFNLTITAQLVAGTGTFGAQWTADGPQDSYTESFSTTAAWFDATGLDKDSNTATGTSTLSNHVRGVRGIATVGDASTVIKYTILQG